MQLAVARPPELVRVAVDHPVGAELGRGQAGHARHDRRLLEPVTRSPDQAKPAVALVGAKDVRRAVHRPVVGGDHEIDAVFEMEAQLRVDDVRLVPDEEGHDDSHQERRGRRKSD